MASLWILCLILGYVGAVSSSKPDAKTRYEIIPPALAFSGASKQVSCPQEEAKSRIKRQITTLWGTQITSTPTEIRMEFPKKRSRNNYYLDLYSGGHHLQRSPFVSSPSYTFRGLTPDTEYKIDVHFNYYIYTSRYRTKKEISLSLNLSTPTQAGVAWRDPNVATSRTSHRLVIETRALACEDSYRPQHTTIQQTGSQAIPVQPYTSLRVCAQALGVSGSVIYETCDTVDTPAALPENKIEEIDCKGDSVCVLKLDSDCHLVHGPELCFFYKFHSLLDEERPWDHLCPLQRLTSSVSIFKPLDLLPFMNYTFVVRPGNKTQLNDKFELLQFTTFRTPSTAPGKVRDLTVTPAATSLTLTWLDPDDNPPRGQLEKFLIKWRKESYGSEQEEALALSKVPKDSKGRRSYTIKGLMPVEKYSVEVAAKNVGVYSYGAPEHQSTSTVRGVPSPPQAVKESISDGEVVITWESPSNQDAVVTYYVISVDGHREECHSNSTCTLKSLRAGVEHEVTVKACNSEDCSVSKSLMVTGPGVKTEYIVLSVVIVVLFLLCLVALLVIWHRRREGASKEVLIRADSTDTNNLSMKCFNAEDQEEFIVTKSVSTSAIYENIPLDVAKADVENYLSRAIHSQDIDLEFGSVPRIMKKSCSIGGLLSNRCKNRYKNNIPYDDTRVILPPIPDEPYSDYVNASYVNGSTREKAFIVCQGPKDNTISDFWRMIWHTKTRVIVMVTRLVEGGRVKVAQYWPDKEPISKNGVEVFLKSENVKMDYTVRTFGVKCDKEEREVVQYQFMTWPDHGVPQQSYSLAQMITSIKNKETGDGPIIVHCSAGIGRSGTVLLVLHVLDHLQATGIMNIHKSLVALREARPLVVENVAQYKFAHQLLLELLCGEKTSIPCVSFVEKLKELRTLQSPTQMSVLHTQYKKLMDLPKDLSFAFAKSPKHAHLNRNQKIVPADSRMVFLQNLDGGTSYYVNATFVNGLDQKDEFVVTEHPMSHTLDNVWRMVYEKKIPVWVLIHSYPENKDFPNVLPPRNEIWNLKTMTVETVSNQYHNSFSETLVKVCCVMDEKVVGSHQCTVLQLADWPFNVSLPTSPEPLIALLEHLHSLPRHTGPKLFSCRDGVVGSGVAVALQLVISRIRLLQEVDVYRAVHSVTYDRPQFITTFEQYDFLHEAVKVFLETQSIYANFT